MNTDFDEQNALNFNPFDGDFGDQSDRILKNKIGIARKSGECHDCAEEIKKDKKGRSNQNDVWNF